MPNLKIKVLPEQKQVRQCTYVLFQNQLEKIEDFRHFRKQKTEN